MNRRIFLKDSALAMVGIGAAPMWLQRAMYASDTTAQRKKILVAIFQRGAADGLNIVVPHGEKRYYELRPTLHIPQPTAGTPKEQSVIDLDGLFGFNPALAPLKSVWDDGHLALIHASGSPDPTRSHFDAQDYMESGTPGIKSIDGGWMNRALLPVTGPESPVRAIALGASLPRALRGANDAIAIESLRSFQVRDNNAAKIFENLYLATDDQVLNGTGKETFEAVSILKKVQNTPYTPANGAAYPNGRFGDSLKQIAQLIKANVGVEVAFADYGGWDHHVQEMNALPNMLRDFGGSLAAFWNDLGDLRDNVVVVTMSEFGRTAKENGTRGTDHGHANVMFVMGGPVKGGKVYGKWPGLAEHELYEKRDLAVTTDFRAVLGEVVSNHIGNKDIIKVFPGYPGGPQDFRGFLKV
ncbi:MAG TPA: DUF1501 domain-containing protein [Bryobacteraceae bacterium]|jgi:uncharacterized protein (DUF1501 family)